MGLKESLPLRTIAFYLTGDIGLVGVIVLGKSGKTHSSKAFKWYVAESIDFKVFRGCVLIIFSLAYVRFLFK